MAALAAAKRWARLCAWLGLSATSMMIAACGAWFSGGCKSTSLKNKDASPEASVAVNTDVQPSPDLPGEPDLATTDVPTIPNPAARDAGSVDEAEGETNPTVDGGKSDLWEIICE